MTKKLTEQKSVCQKNSVKTIPAQKSITVKSQTTDILLKKSKRHKFLAEKLMVKCVSGKTFKLKSFYDNGFDI